MIGQIVEIVETDRRLTKVRGSLVISSSSEELGRIAFDDIASVIVNNRGVTQSAGVLAELAKRAIPFVVTDKNFHPVATVLPFAGNYETSARIDNQINASVPTKKRLWKELVKAKITMQALALETIDQDAGRLWKLEGSIRSGDPENIEAQAARIYWQRAFGPTFRRVRNATDENALLNYGYAIIRTATARAIAATGLHPAIGIHHRGPHNTMRLADDLVEPFRPLVDLRVLGIVRSGQTVLTPDTKRDLIAVLNTDVPTPIGLSPVSVSMLRLAQSLNKVYSGADSHLELLGRSTRPALQGLIEVPDDRTIGIQADVDRDLF